jgi:alginate O-acetyltransferase complex protein AlgI
MQFPTLTFTLFFLLALALWWGGLRATASARTRSATLLAFSLVFYAWADWRWLGVLLGVGTLAWAGSRWAAATERGRGWRLGLVIGALVAHLILWKYTLWLTAERNDLAALWGAPAWALPEWAYPVGLSFFTFHALALVLAAGRRRVPQPSWLDTLTHVAFFPALLAGPVLQAEAILPRLRLPFVWAEVPWLEGIARIAMGMGFKWVLASQAAVWADPVFAGMADSAGQVWWGVHAYALQIFFDFAGYSHMALGVALLLGFRLPENFTQPYLATSFQDFWRRWHRSLSFFFRDHLYIEAFGGNRHGKAIALLSAAATMVVSGLWHGASVTFLIWGGWHAGALVLERLWPGRGRWPAWLGWGVTFEGVVWGWVWFRAEDLATARAVIGQAFGDLPWTAAVVPGPLLVGLLWLGAMAAAVGLERGLLTAAVRWSTFVDHPQAPRWAVGLTAIGLSLWAALVMALGPVGVPPFIYNGF